MKTRMFTTTSLLASLIWLILLTSTGFASPANAQSASLTGVTPQTGSRK